MTSASSSSLLSQSSPVSFLSSLLKASSVTPTALQTLNVEALQTLKTKLTGGTIAAANNTADSSASSSSSRGPSAADPLAFTWLNLQRTLPPSGANATSADVQSIKTLHAAFLSAVATLCDDERSSNALADTAGVIHRAMLEWIRREKEIREKDAASHALTADGTDAYHASSQPIERPELLAELKELVKVAKKEVETAASSKATEITLRKFLSLTQQIQTLTASMQAKYDQLRLLRELKQIDNNAASANSLVGTFIASSKDSSIPTLPMEAEFGADLPMMEDDSDAASADDDDLRPRRLAEQMKASMTKLGLLKSSTAASLPAAPKPVLSLTPGGSDDADDEDDDDDATDALDDLYVGESEDDESEREQHRLAAINSSSVRVITEPKAKRQVAAQSSSSTMAAYAEPLELPTSPIGWWNWLIIVCDPLVQFTDEGLPVLSSGEIAQQLLGILQSSRPDAQIQNELLDTVGMEGMDLLAGLLKHRKELRQITSSHQAQARTIAQSRHESQMSDVKRDQLKGKDGAIVNNLVGISIHSQADIESAKNRRRADRRHARRSAREQPEDKFAIDEEKLDAQANQLKSRISTTASQMHTLLPQGTVRTKEKDYEQVYIPPLPKYKIDESELRTIEASFEPFARQAFPKTKTLNRIQSAVYESAYHHNNNLLICAPTGAGKTNVAMMCILREVNQHIVNGVLQKDMFKMVYVAPMKALAQEVQATFQARLAPLGLIVKELTGDMQLTRKEIAETHLIVTTPEKYDVVSRKNSDSSGTGLMSLIKLLIIDECHLLNEDRGPVLEILVARTLRLVESSQQMCRIVGLSATLPNYHDVATFLRANNKDGLFHFDQSYRPVPLAQTFIGATETNSMKKIQSMNEICYKKVMEALRQGQQVMVFVHSRRDTVKTARFLREQAQHDQNLAFFSGADDPAYPVHERKIMRSRNSDLTELFPAGFAMHHAGMVRADRSAVEAAFGAGVVKVLCCTATLAWGVNLPTTCVIIKGTQIYDAEKGGFVDVGMLDIMQIFGRAGRPQFMGDDDFGNAILICEHEKLTRYLGMLTHQMPIESQFIKELPNHLNAEIILGTVTTLQDAVDWLSYTYLYTRMIRNPMVYGITYDESQFDELLVQQRQKLIIDAAKMLMRCRMIKFDQKSGQFYSTDVGRVASHYYLHFESIELYNTLLQPVMSDEDILNLLASSKEFTQIRMRDEEVQELSKLRERYVPYKLKGGNMDSPTGKQNVLLQCYISNAVIDGPTLISDSYFIQQSAGRICRALFEMVLKRGKAYLAAKFLSYAKMIELKMWDFQTPLRQFLTSMASRDTSKNNVGTGGGQTGGLLKMSTIQRIEDRKLKIDELVEMDAKEIGAILKHDTLGYTVKDCINSIPFISVEATVQPITRTVLKIDMSLTPEFNWSDRLHGQQESFWIWIEDTNNEHIYHHEFFQLTRKKMGEVHKLVFTIPISEPLPPQYYIKIVSDRWLGSENTVALSFKHLLLPEMYPANTALLDLHPIPRSALMNAEYEKLYAHKFTHFNPIQTQIFHTLYHTDENILLGAPTGSGKTIVSELAMLRLFSMYPGQKVVYIAPLKALARERIEDWTSSKSFKGLLNKKIVELTGDTAPDQQAILASDIIITTPEKWDGISRQWATRSYVKSVGLVIIDEIHLLGADRGPVLEVIVSRMRYISAHTASPIRIVGLSTALSNAKDLGDWLGIERAGLYNFPPSVRPVPLTIHISGYAGKAYCPRMALMNKPTYAAIQTHSPKKPVLVFVSSRRQTRLTALDLISFSAADGDPRKWMHLTEAQLQNVLQQISDPNLRHMISFGIGMHHAGLNSKDRQIVEKLFLELKIQVLVCTSTLAWGVNFPAHLVVVKGTEYYDAAVKRYVDFPITDVLQMIGRAGRPQFDDDAKAVVLVQESKKNYYFNFLHSPFPVESSLLAQLHDHINAEICASGTIKCISDFLDYLSWTFFFRRLLLNPSYYGLEGTTSDKLNKYLMELVERVLNDLERAGLILQDEEHRSVSSPITPLTLGKISAFYYLKYQTMIVFSERLRSDAGVEQLLEVLSHTQEYAELPVRHNEDKMNADWNSDMRWRVDTSAFDSPHIKTHMLLQAHFSRLSFPISDYVTDLKSVLDQSIRILQAMVDTTSEAGWLSTSICAMQLMQMVVQGRWQDDETILNLPGVDSNERLYNALQKEKLTSLYKLIRADKNKVAQLAKSCMSEKEANEFIEAVSRMPNVQMQLATAVAAADSSSSSSSSQQSKQQSLSRPLTLPSGSTLALNINLHRQNSNPNVRILTPVFSKPKDEAWWLVIGLSNTKPQPRQKNVDPTILSFTPQDELIAMKRVMNLKSRQTIKMKVTLPSSVRANYYTVYLVSDSYIGVDQQMSFEINTTNEHVLGSVIHEGYAPDAAAAATAAVMDADDIYS